MRRNHTLIVLRTLVAFSLWCFSSKASWFDSPAAQLDAAVTRLHAAVGPASYTAIRELWAAWGTTDPEAVEAELLAASRDSRLEARVRAYAALFAAHARTRRGDVEGAKRRISELGYATEWLVLGPFDNEGKVGLATDFGPEAEGAATFTVRRTYSGKERPVHWRTLPKAAFPFGWLEGGSLFRPEENICYYAATEFIRATPHAQPLSVWIGSSGANKVFINGSEVSSDAEYRGHDVDRSGIKYVAPSGRNQILIKVCGTQSAPALSLRVADENGAPLSEGPQFLAPELAPGDASPKLAAVRVLDAKLGPIARFDALTSVPRPKAGALEDYAKYLSISQADDPAQHLARDLARKAAELEPSIERLLLAGALSEDENQQRVWIERAEQLAKKPSPDQNVQVLLARAQLERSGLSFRDAFPFYQQALSIAPAHLAAVQGVAEMYSEVGLGRSALATIEAALRVEPYSVNLLNLYAYQLRNLGREREALETEARYAQFRFDDAGYLSQSIDVALAANNKPAALHWVERMLQLNPGSVWARSVAASAHRRLGDPQGAIAALKQALELAPEDVTLLRGLSDLQGELGSRVEQKRLLHQILTLKPQTRDVAEYVEHVEPEQAKQDEAYAWKSDRFLKQRLAPADGDSRRTLLDLSVTTVFENGLSSQYRQLVFQPLSDSAAALSRNYVFGFQGDTQQVQLRGAKVYRTDGRVDEAVETGIGAADDPAIAMYTSAQTFYVQFPRLEPGDVVELRYRIDDITPRNEFADYFGDIQYLQKTEPVNHAEYVLITPKSRKLFIDYHGVPGLKMTTEDKDSRRVYRFVAENLAPLEPEPAMPPITENLGFIHVSTFADYGALGRWFWGQAKDQFDLDDETRRLAHQIADGYVSPREKVAAVYNWVIKNTRYVALEFGIYGVKPRRCVQTVARGWGDCKDKATVIVSLLRELGIDSTIVILRTQMRGAFYSKVASLAAFDHAIAYVPSMNLFLDGTAEFTGTNELPAMDQGALGILVNQGDAKLVTLPVTSPSNDVRTVHSTVALDPSGRADVQIEIEVRGTQAPDFRRRYQAKASQRNRATTDLSPGFPGLELNPGPTGLVVESDDFEKPVQLKAIGRVASYGRPEGSYVSIAATTRVRLSDQYAPASSRRLDVSIPSFGTVDETHTISLPRGYKLISGPAPVNQTSPFGRYLIEVSEAAGSIQIRSLVALSVNRIKPRDYPAWRAFCQQVDTAMASRLVVGK